MSRGLASARAVAWAVAIVLLLAAPRPAAALLFDFETEDDFVTAMQNGQIVDAAFDADPTPEYTSIFTITSRLIGTGGGHLGVTVFDSDSADQLPGTQDPDLLVELGNILILQNDDSPGTVLERRNT